ncbi:uncharacterized protein LOC129794134 isoform X2 [Lutzomyia longipalpis]|nr:uncharacterized protein LOC129794134 isoform X2 [Lutzomyia longipalpis]
MVEWTFRWLPAACGGLGPILLPPAHIAILYYFWQSYSRYVDRRFCSCSCWDTVFKGTYESGIASYKHLYFNATPNTLKIWILTVVAIISLYECTKYLTKLVMKRCVRYSMVVLFISSIFSHYYAWWAYVNYYNDDFYTQWNHQLFFSLTELISTTAVLHLAHTDNLVTTRKALCIVGIALLHIAASGFDQFISNVIRGEGYPHQVVRDLGFMIPDLLHLLLPLFLLRKVRREGFSTRPLFRDQQFQKDIMAMLFIVATLFIICSFL